jgi:MATE family multidrug resistance protein
MFFTSRGGKGGVAELLTIAVPMIVSASCDGIMTFTDRLFLSRLGPELMNAAMGGGVAMQMMVFFFIGLTGYTTALVAQYFGAGQMKMTSVAAFQAVLISFAAYPLILACKPLGILFFHFMKVAQGQLDYQELYFNIVIYGTLIGMVRNVMSCYFSGIGRTRIVMIASLTAMLVNVVLDYILIYGKAGLPAMGIKGAALATVFGSICGLLVLVAAYFHRHNRLEFHIGESFRFHREAMVKLLNFGYPAGMELFLNFLAFTSMIMLFHSHGPVSATASTIMFNWDLITFIPLLGIEIAVTSLVGRYMGAGEPNTAHKAAISGICSGIWYSLAITLLFVSLPGYLAGIFHPREADTVFRAALPVASSMIRIAAIYVTAEAVMVAIVGALRGAGDTKFTMLVSVSAHWTFVPLLYAILHLWNMTVVQAWMALVTVFLLFCGVLIIRFRSRKWMNIRILNH